jgi:RNA polymerase sigma-70 factor (ECF subfamily)
MAPRAANPRKPGIRIVKQDRHDDLVLMQRIARGDQQALGQLYDRYGRLVYGLARSVVGDELAAEEITQDAFTRVWSRAGTYLPEQGRPLTWLMRIARNRAIDELRSRSSRPQARSLSWLEEDLPDGGADLAEEAELSRRRREVAGAIAALPEEQRQVLAMAYFQAYTHREIAGILKQPLGTVKTRLRSAMKRLRAALEER